jgi:hypothetical protein
VKDSELRLRTFPLLPLAGWFLTVVIASALAGCGGGSSSSGGSGGGTTTPTPSITSISPTTAPAGSAALTLTVSGSGFTSSSVVQVNGNSEATTYVSANKLTATVPANQLASGAMLSVVVLNGSLTSASGTPVSFEIDNPAPAISSLSPATEQIGATTLTVTVTGTGFVPATVIQVNGSARSTSFTSATQVSVTLTGTDVAQPGSLSLTAVNAKPGGGTSAAASINVIAPNPVPAISSLSPSTETVGATLPVVTVSGTGFISSTVISVNGNARPTNVVSSSQVLVTLAATDLAATGTLALTATNPAPGGGTSPAVNLPVNNPSIGSIQLNPSGLAVGGATPVTVTVTGTTFVPTSVVNVNGSPRATTYISSTSLTFVITVADQANPGTLAVTVTNPSPGGGTSPAATLTIAPQLITSVTPSSIVAGTPGTTITVSGFGFSTASIVQWNGSPLLTTINWFFGALQLVATVPAADLASVGTASVTVSTPGLTPAISNAVTVSITNAPAPALTSIYPGGGPLNQPQQLTINGTGFSPTSTVLVNGTVIPSTYASPTQLNATLSALNTAAPGNLNITVNTPAPGGGVSQPLPYTVYLAIPNNDIVYNSGDGLLYASVPSIGIGNTGNSVVGIDPVTGNIVRSIWVGTTPNKLALSTDNTQLFVGIDGAGSVAQVDLTKGAIVNEFPLGGGQGVYNPPSTAAYLAAVPGYPNSVAVASTGGLGNGAGVTIYDSGVARSRPASNAGEGPMSFGSSASTLYLATGSIIDQLTVDSTGVTAINTLNTPNTMISALQYDNGQIYLSNGQVLNASSGALLGTFYSTATNAANGPVVSDSSLKEAFIAQSNFTSSGQVLVFDEPTFNSKGSIPVNAVGVQGYGANFQKIVRWGRNGIAVSAATSPFTSLNQIFIFQSPLVQDNSASQADIAVVLHAPSSAITGTPVNWVATVGNNGPLAAQDVLLAMSLDSSLAIQSITPSQGSCGSGALFTCDLGTLANGATATVTVAAIPTVTTTVAGVASVSAATYDPTGANNQSSSSTTITGSLYGAVPVLSSISPNLVQAGSTDFNLTLNGSGFNVDSIVNIGVTPLATSYVNAGQLSATVTAAEIAQYGWAAITVTNPAPGGGVSQIVPLTIFDLVNVPANAVLFEPYSQLLYATLPGTAPNLSGNSVVTIDPSTGSVGTPVPVGSQPDVMAETGDGNYLYIGLNGSDSLAQFDLLKKKVNATIPLSLTQGGTTSNMTATSLAVMPGNDNTLAIGITNTWGNFGIFDVSGNTGSFRPNLSGIYAGVTPVFADASHVYAYDSQTSGAEFYRYTVDANGLTLIDGTTLNGMGGFYGSLQLADGLVYGAAGGIANPSTTPPSEVAQLPMFDFYNSGTSPAGDGLAVDPSLQKEFLMLENRAGTSAFGLARYDLTTYRPEALLEMPQSISSTFNSWSIFRWGQDGLVLLVQNYNPVTSTSTPQLLLLRGPYVTPQLLNMNASAASLTASSATTIAHGAGNTTLTLTGSNFQPGVAVTWNGNYRTTTIVDPTHVSVAIPASDFVSAGTAKLKATNPGASGSNTLTITIQ